MIQHLLELQIIKTGYRLEEGALAFSECVNPRLNIIKDMF
jgi:hypothetical protein